MRAFVAIDLPALEGPLPSGLRPEDHLTLHFFEELPVERVPPVVEAMTEAARAWAPFTVEVHGIGAFPRLDRPRVVWAGVGEGSTEVQGLTNRLRQSLATRGFAIERRPFVPHLTLARVRSSTEAVWAGRLLVDPALATRRWVRATVSELLLKESELLPTGARHTVRERVRLSGAPPATSSP